MSDGYYLNGLRARKAALQKEHRLLMARYERLARQMHPSTIGHGRMVELNKRMIELVDSAIAKEEARP